MKKLTLAMALLGFAGWSGSAISHERSGYYFDSDDNHVIFDSDSDTDGDGRLSLDEYKAQKNRWDSDDDDQIFHDIDDNGDGYIEEDELAEYVEVRVGAAMEALDDLDFEINIDFDFDRDFDWEDGSDYTYTYLNDYEGMTREERLEMRDEMRDVGRELGRGIGHALRGVFRGNGSHGRNFMYVSRSDEVVEHAGVDDRSFFVKQEYGDDISFNDSDVTKIVDKQKDEILAKMDVNDDGDISKDEFDGPNSAFENMDDNDDGKLSRDEIQVRVSFSRVVRVPEFSFGDN